MQMLDGIQSQQVLIAGLKKKETYNFYSTKSHYIQPNSAKYIPKSRYASISYFISNDPICKEEYNDLNYPVNEKMMEYAEKQAKTLGKELDDRLKRHLGFLFLQDPMVVFSDKIYVDDSQTTNHFEVLSLLEIVIIRYQNIQSTNWNSVRFKPPPNPTSEVGW